eukprot:12885019-Prorocentrum_lima.AAC.1
MVGFALGAGEKALFRAGDGRQISLADTEASTNTSCQMQGAVGNAKKTVVQLWMSACMARKNPGAVLVEEP